MARGSRVPGPGLKASDLLGLPADQRRLLQCLMRHGAASLTEIAEALGDSEQALAGTLESLRVRGYVTLLSVRALPVYDLCWQGGKPTVEIPPAPDGEQGQ